MAADSESRTEKTRPLSLGRVVQQAKAVTDSEAAAALRASSQGSSISAPSPPPGLSVAAAAPARGVGVGVGGGPLPPLSRPLVGGTKSLPALDEAQAVLVEARQRLTR